MAMLGLALALLQLLPFASSAPTVSFPLNSQLPPAARIDELFQYSFSPYTFTSDAGGNLTYSLSNQPKWLSIDSEERRLYGIPKDDEVESGDVVGQSFQIVADDGSGSVSMDATLVVSRNPAPTIHVPLSQQIENFGHYSAPSSLLSYPSTKFEYSFSQDTFESNSDELNYYATSGNSSPLPAWISFDASNLTFSGTTPAFESLIQPPQNFSFQLVASDIVGFSAGALEFSIVVGSHKLTTDNPSVELNATRGSKLSYKDLDDGVKVDDQPVKIADIHSSTDGLPDWLSFDPKTWAIEGTPGSDDRSTNFTITLKDDFSDSLDVLVIVNIATGLFKVTPGDIVAEPGEDVNLDMEDYLRDPKDTTVKVTTDPDANWLKVDGLKISGKVPSNASGKLKVSIKASSKSSDLSETETLGIKFENPDASTTSSQSSTSTQTKSTNSATSAGDSDKDSDKDSSDDDDNGVSTTTILLATIIPIVALALLLMLIVCCLRRRRARRTYLTEKMRTQISQPMTDTLTVNGSQLTVQQTEKMADVRPGTSGGSTLKPEKRVYAEAASDLSSRSGSSGSWGTLSSGGGGQNVYMTGAMTQTSRSVSDPTTDDGRGSWFTVEGTKPTLRTNPSVHSHCSDTTFSEAAHQQLLPQPGFLSEAGDNSFRSGLELTIPSLEDLPSLQPTPDLAYVTPPPLVPKKSFDMLSSASSDVLPKSQRGSPKMSALGSVVQGSMDRKKSPGKSRGPLAEVQSEDNITELRQPAQARLSSHQWISQKYSDGSETLGGGSRSRSLGTETSFGSSENWRVIGPPRGGRDRDTGTSISYRELVEEAPFNPSRPSTAGGELMSPSKWGKAETAATTTTTATATRPTVRRLSTEMVEEDKENEAESWAGARSGWRREDSAKTTKSNMTDGSYKVFL